MRLSFFGLATGLAIAGLSSAVPSNLNYPRQLLSTRSISPDNTCGNSFAGANNSYTCDATVNPGGCCSAYGYCGNSTDYCGTGCQTAFGTCNPEAVVNTFQCGTQNGNLACSGGLCCSGAGFCGNTTDYCLASNGCQPGFGTCTGTIAPAAGGVCGPSNGNAVCGGNQCCSVAGYCGNTTDFCADPNNCQLGFGRCDSDATPAGPATINAPRPLLGSLTYTDDIIDCTAPNVVALSYDDGPYNYTSQLLDILQSYNFTATFFITGNNNGKGEIDITAPYPSLIQRMISEGHQVASHTWSHYSLDNITQAQRVQQMVKNEMAFNNIIGKWPTYMRPPYSQCTAATGCEADLQALGYHRVYFDLDTQDYLNPSPLQIQNSKNIVQAALQVAGVSDYLAIQHDIVQQSVTNLSSFFFDQIKAKGWKGVTVGECLGDSPNNWYRSLSGTATSVSLPISLPTTVASTPATSVSKTSTLLSSTAGTSRVATTTAPSSTSKSPTPTPTPTPSCLRKVGSFCGNIAPFSNQAACQTSVLTCYTNTATCLAQGWAYFFQCYEYTSVCADLNSYCKTCGKSCSSVTFVKNEGA